MRQSIQRTLGALLVLATVQGLAGCDSFFSVTDPDRLQANRIDPVKDGEVLARSAYQNFAEAYGDVLVYSAWWSDEARVGDTFPTRNEFGRRFIDDTNGTLNSEVWSPLSRAASTGEQAVQTFTGANATGLPLVIAAFTAGYSAELMAETFCEGSVSSEVSVDGPRMSKDDLLNLAIERFQMVQDAAASVSGSEAANLAMAAKVGLARAYLFRADNANAASAAAGVPADFEFDVTYVDDPANRGRLGNNVYAFTTGRQSLVVPPEYRALADAGDPRITYDDAGHLAQDSELEFFRQQKFPSYGSAVRLASGLEARYIAAEASGDMSTQLSLVNERRAIGGEGPFTSTDPQAVLAELMRQKAIDFWLEGQKMGDYRRNGDLVPWVPPAGSAYYKSGVGDIGTQTCFPVPTTEKDNNPNW